ncbi:S-layer homology domain-containing protein [Brasilonema sp. UFV-L1]|uniref:S-layer homology domain-containing protein n=1 Tax=Brasilonema sp. UFV-L1 TaxID=2234130 RepID=UPI00145D9EE7|nr:S-layer homology domain-containing protein [Brasilonema sp. UFV-L1]
MVHCKHPVILVSLAVLLTSLTACANSPAAKNFEESLAADPKLKNNPATFGAQEVRSRQQSQTPEATVQLPADFPKDIPLYPNATLQEVTPSSNENSSVSTRWLSSDPSNFIANYYRQQFQANNWQVIQGTSTSDEPKSSLEARRNDIQLKVFIQPKTVTNAAPNQPQTSTEIQISYSRDSTQSNPTPTSTPQVTDDAAVQPGEPQFVGPVQSQDSATQQSGTLDNKNPTPTPSSQPNSQEFSDLNKVPQEFRQYIQDLAALGVLTVESNGVKSSGSTTNQFDPGKIVTRRQFARWLVAANNAMYVNNPAKQIRLASENSQPTFQDVPKTDPDFRAIQGLAEAGLIPSTLSGDSTAVLFQPDAPLTREQLILWKVPLDTRQALPSANLEAVKQTWGFQDAGKIDPKALRAVLADFQNAEKSNIRRVFGYTTLFQPKKPVTRVEAGAVLWYFGTQGEGISAHEALKLAGSQSQ